MDTPAPVARCPLCAPDAAYETKFLAPSGKDANELYKSCGCKPCHRHCVNTAALKNLAQGNDNWTKCDSCRQQFNLDDRTRLYLEGAASQAAQIERLKHNAGDSFNAMFQMQEDMMKLEWHATAWRAAAAVLAAAAVAVAVRFHGTGAFARG